MMNGTSDGAVRIELNGEVVRASTGDWMDAANALVAKHGGGVPRVSTDDASDDRDALIDAPAGSAIRGGGRNGIEEAKGFSDFGGNLVTDDAAKVRIEAMHSTLNAAGIKVDASNQYFATGTRMARDGYAMQAARKIEHAKQMQLADAAEQLKAIVLAEKREDHVCVARDVADSIKANGKLTVFGYSLTETAIRGLLERVKSPATRYVFGLRDRIATATAIIRVGNGDESVLRAQMAADKAKIADVLRHECLASPDAELKMRRRQANGDVYAVVAPSYSPADAPEVIAQVLADLPEDARGTWAYDSASTTWEFRASIWTPTAVEEQAVGEPFEGWVSFRSRDNGNGSFRVGGGVTLLRCLNASTYCESNEMSRAHRGKIMRDISAMLPRAADAINILCQAWGDAREVEIDGPTGVSIEDLIPGFWRYQLRAGNGELAGVLAGRSVAHVEGLTKAYFDERRDPNRIVQADFAQGWTRYVQGQEPSVRREAEAAIGTWLVKQRPMVFEPA